MPYRTIPFVDGEYYHLFNRGLQKQIIFNDQRDYKRFIQAFFYYQIQNPKPKLSLYKQSKIFPMDTTKKIVDILCFCLMPNHFHLLVKQIKDGGISEFMRRFTHSYTKYHNLKHNHQGPVFQGMFKAVRVETDEQLIHLSRYIHLNPLVSFLVKNLDFYTWSSYHSFLNSNNIYPLAKEEILKFFAKPEDYKQFVMDQAEYGKTLEQIKHLIIDYE
ncbi:transposase [Candidatus Daviesbacteria bacterium]|nr:transposase [Candidatus Daviesbacteria bacterium]